MNDDWIDDVIQAVAELPDRNSPEGWPEAMLVTGAELREILARHTGAGSIISGADRTAGGWIGQP